MRSFNFDRPSGGSSCEGMGICLLHTAVPEARYLAVTHSTHFHARETHIGMINEYFRIVYQETTCFAEARLYVNATRRRSGQPFEDMMVRYHTGHWSNTNATIRVSGMTCKWTQSIWVYVHFRSNRSSPVVAYVPLNSQPCHPCPT